MMIPPFLRGMIKKRREGDLRNLISAYRCFLKAASQTADAVLQDDDRRKTRSWKGGFGKAVHLLFHKWPTPHQSGEFEKLMRWRLKKAKNKDQAFVLAFNDYLAQKPLSAEELSEVLAEGRRRSKM